MSIGNQGATTPNIRNSGTQNRHHPRPFFGFGGTSTSYARKLLRGYSTATLLGTIDNSCIVQRIFVDIFNDLWSGTRAYVVRTTNADIAVIIIELLSYSYCFCPEFTFFRWHTSVIPNARHHPSIPADDNRWYACIDHLRLEGSYRLHNFGWPRKYKFYFNLLEPPLSSTIAFKWLEINLIFSFCS